MSFSGSVGHTPSKHSGKLLSGGTRSANDLNLCGNPGTSRENAV